MVTTALPVAVRAGGRSAVADDKMVGKASPTPAPMKSHPGRNALA
jgi:hypothetical protein